MSKNNMKLIMEGWRHSIKEMNAAAVGGVQGHAGQDEQLDEGAFKTFMTMIGLMIGGQAAAMNVDLGDGTVVKVKDIAQVLQADGTAKSASAADDVLKMIKAKPEDANKDGKIDARTEYNLDGQSLEHIKSLIDAAKAPQADAQSQPDDGKTMQQRVRDANQKDGGAFRNLKEGGI